MGYELRGFSENFKPNLYSKVDIQKTGLKLQKKPVDPNLFNSFNCFSQLIIHIN
jgi:hypothetical protein